MTPAGLAAGVVIDAVVVKGGAAYNLYTSPAVLPPALAGPQDYVSPLVGSSNVPRISHWFVCYRITDTPQGTLAVNKDVIPSDGIPVNSLPLNYSVLVTCDAPGFEPVTLSFGRGGGYASAPDDAFISGLPVGTLCTVTEENTGTLPPGTSVSYSPGQTVEITADEGIRVVVINDFGGIAVRYGSFTITKEVQSEITPAELPAEFLIDYACTDGTAGTVSLPNTGGTSQAVPVKEGAFCAVAEDASGLPAGWTVSYSVGQIVTPDAALLPILTANESVTVVNVAPAPTPTPTPDPTLAPDTPGDGDGELAASGSGSLWALTVVGLTLALGGGVMRTIRGVQRD